MSKIMIPIANKPYEIPEYKEYELPNKVVVFMQQLEEENNRLNNIINELEKYIKTEIPEDDFINSELCVNILDKLKELKEGK